MPHLAVRGTRPVVIKGREIPMHEAEMLPRYSGNATCTPRTHSRVRRRSSRSATELAVPMTAAFETILLDFDRTDHVATITLNRPDRLNAFNRTM